ncbi:Nucleotide-binding protein Ldb0621, partial [Frankliniella fusca]
EFVILNKEATAKICSEELGYNLTYQGTIFDTVQGERDWLQHLGSCITSENTDVANVSWSAFHASRQTLSKFPSINALLPLFHENASSVSMIRHGMTVVRDAIKYLNPGQIPILVGDQPLFALGKLIQWNCPVLSEDKKVFEGWWLDIGVSVNAGIIDRGSAEAVLTVKHVTKTSLMHEVTCAALYSLMHEAYEELKPDHSISFDTFLTEMAEKYPTFKYCLTLFNLEIILLNFVRSIRSRE